jgi:ribosome maturation factor RimP
MWKTFSREGTCWKFHRRGWTESLPRPSDYTYFVGRRARVVLKEAVGEQTVLEGRLAGFENGRVRLDLGEHGLQELDLNNIRKAQLVVEL